MAIGASRSNRSSRRLSRTCTTAPTAFSSRMRSLPVSSTTQRSPSTAMSDGWFHPRPASRPPAEGLPRWKARLAGYTCAERRGRGASSATRARARAAAMTAHTRPRARTSTRRCGDAGPFAPGLSVAAMLAIRSPQMAVRAQRLLALGGHAEEYLRCGAVGGVAAQAFHMRAGAGPGVVPEPRPVVVAGFRVPAVVLGAAVPLGGVNVQRVVLVAPSGVAGLAEVGAGGEQEKAAVLRQVRVVAHIAVLARLSRLDRVLGQGGIEDVQAAGRHRPIVAAVAGRRDPSETPPPLT